MTSTLSQGLVPGLLGRFYVGRRSGVLHFTRGDERRSVSLVQGRIVNANTNVEEDRLGEILVRRGVLSRDALDAALEIVFQRGTRLGYVLQELGILDEDRLDDALAAHVRQVLGKVFSWSDGSYAFEEEDDPAGTPLRTLPTAEIILEAARQLEDPDVVRYALGDVDRILVLAPDHAVEGQKLALTAAEGYVLSRVDGTSTMREILKVVPLTAEETRRTLLGLLAAGILQCRPAAGKAETSGAAARTASMRNASPEAPRPAPGPPAPIVSPPRLRVPAIADPEKLFDPLDDALVIEGTIRQADRFLFDEKYWDAIQLLQGTIPRIHGRILRDKAQVLLARAYLKNPNWGHRAEELLQKVVTENPQNGEALFILGTVYEARGLKSRAEVMYRKALEVRPLHREAAARLKALASTPLLKKLFGKS